MSLWTPYSDTALDLSKTAKEQVVPRGSPSYGYMYSPYQVAVAAEQPYFYQYPQPQAAVYSVPADQMSPDSTGSMSSYQRFSPHSLSALSPPDSPEFMDADSLSEDLEYQAFERDALQAMAEKNGGSLLLNNPRMRRAVQTSQDADEAYRTQRERNNFAAKQSRDRRKLREVRLALKVTFLKKQVSKLKARLATQPCVRCFKASAC